MSKSGRRQYNQVARAQARQRTREALLSAAIDQFYDGDWSKASLETLASTAGVTKQTLLRHFGSKEDLLMQALLHSSTQVVGKRWNLSQGDIEGAVENLLDHYRVWGKRAVRIDTWKDGPPALAILARAGRQFHYEWIDYAFGPQLEQLQGQARTRCRAALIAVCDVQSWWILSNDLTLERAEIHAILTYAIKRLLAAER